MKALIDGDIIAHSVAAACEGVYYGVPEPKDQDLMHFFEYKKDAKEFCKIHSLDPGLWISSFKDPEPVENCLHSVKLLTESIIRESGADSHRIFLSGSNNFRLDVCPDYKAHRPTEKPVHLKACREYLVNKYKAEIVDGMEADDAMGIAQTDNTIICTIDKDLDTIQGWHYNWRKNKKYWVSEEEADRFFWSQMLIGDTADNIFGIKGVGVKRAAKILDASDNYECTVGLQYAIEFDDPEAMFEKNKRLLGILKEMPNG